MSEMLSWEGQVKEGPLPGGGRGIVELNNLQLLHLISFALRGRKGKKGVSANPAA